MSNNFGHGQCTEQLDTGRQCPQAAYGDDSLCYYHGKLSCRLTRRLAQEDKPAPTKKAKAK